MQRNAMWHSWLGYHTGDGWFGEFCSLNPEGSHFFSKFLVFVFFFSRFRVGTVVGLGFELKGIVKLLLSPSLTRAYRSTIPSSAYLIN